MKIKDQAHWDSFQKNNAEGYGKAVMEEAMEQGKKLEDVAEETSHTADTDGITGFMYGAAVSTLASVWEHGEALRRGMRGKS